MSDKRYVRYNWATYYTDVPNEVIMLCRSSPHASAMRLKVSIDQRSRLAVRQQAQLEGAPRTCLPRNGFVLPRHKCAAIFRLQPLNDWQHQLDRLVGINRAILANVGHSTFHLARVNADFQSVIANINSGQCCLHSKCDLGHITCKRLDNIVQTGLAGAVCISPALEQSQQADLKLSGA